MALRPTTRGIALAREHGARRDPARRSGAGRRSYQLKQLPEHAPHPGARGLADERARTRRSPRARPASSRAAAGGGRARRRVRRACRSFIERPREAACWSSTTTRPSAKSIAELLGGEDVDDHGRRRRARRRSRRSTSTRFDCIVLDLKLPKMSGFDAARAARERRAAARRPGDRPHGQGADPARGDAAPRYAETIIVKDARSPERLLDETSLFLHRPESALGAEQRRLLEQVHDADAVFAGQEGPDRRRRRAQRVRAHERARGARDGGRSSPRTAARALELPRRRTRTSTSS